MFVTEVRQAARSLMRRPAFSGLIVLVLALCIGGSALMFAALEAIGLRPLPFEDAQDLTILHETYLPSNGVAYSPSYRNALDWREQSKTFVDLAPFMNWTYRVFYSGSSAERLRVNYIESRYFNLLGVGASVGRVLSSEDDRPGSQAALISHRLWQSRFNGNTDVLGKSLSLDGGVYSIAGVLPESFVDIPLSFEDHAPHRPVEIWLPMSSAPDAFGSGILEDRGSRSLGGVLARLKPGVTITQAREELEGIAVRIGQEFPDNREYGVLVNSLKYHVYGNLARSFNLLFVGSLFVLLIGCINVGSLLLVRGRNRDRELALRAAIGANKRQLMRQVVVEGLLLALAGGLLGFLLAVFAIRIVPVALSLPPLVTMQVNLSILAVVLGITLLTGLIVTVPAALRISGSGLMENLRPTGSRQQGSATYGKGLRPLLVLEIATAIVVLVAAGLLLKSFQTLHQRGMNYDSENLMAARLELRAEELQSYETTVALQHQIVEEARKLPGASGAALWSPGIPGINGTILEIYREGSDPDQDRVQADLHFISPNALAELGIPLLKGREFTSGDDGESDRAGVINDSLAEKLWPGEEVLGKRFRGSTAAPWTTVVGVYKADALTYRQSGRSNLTVLLPMPQIAPSNFAVLVRSSAQPNVVAQTLRERISGISPSIPVFDVATIESRLREEESESRFSAVLMGLYAALAVILTVLGVYGTLSYAVARRTHEIGIRRALGARRTQLFGMILGNATILIVLGVILGNLAALAFSKSLAGLLEGVGEIGWSTYLSVSFLLIVVVLMASLLPARRAVNVDPLIALKEE